MGKDSFLQKNIIDIGFDTFNPILNCGGLYNSIFIVSLLMLVSLVMFAIVLAIIRICYGPLEMEEEEMEGGARDRIRVMKQELTQIKYQNKLRTAK